jgi:peptidoglycan/LPS O-acetylase OafA/YrhL
VNIRFASRRPTTSNTSRRRRSSISGRSAEEQFYCSWPALVWSRAAAVFRAGASRSRSRQAAGSFALSLWLTTARSRELLPLPTRLGARRQHLLALGAREVACVPARGAALLEWGGSLVAPPRSSSPRPPVPGWWHPPRRRDAAVIAAGRRPGRASRGDPRLGAVRYIERISYSLYLCNWPV